jgi:hypothetical protein
MVTFSESARKEKIAPLLKLQKIVQQGMFFSLFKIRKMDKLRFHVINCFLFIPFNCRNRQALHEICSK